MLSKKNLEKALPDKLFSDYDHHVPSTERVQIWVAEMKQVVNFEGNQKLSFWKQLTKTKRKEDDGDFDCTAMWEGEDRDGSMESSRAVHSSQKVESSGRYEAGSCG
jgi:hypothetical protein